MEIIDVYRFLWEKCFFYNIIWTSLVQERTFERPLESKEIKPVNPKGNQPWIFIGRTDAEAEDPILWPPDAKSWLIGTDAGKDWREEKKVATEDEMVGWHHWLSGHEFEQTLGDSIGQGSLERCSPWAANSQTWLSDWTTIDFCERISFSAR